MCIWGPFLLSENNQINSEIFFCNFLSVFPHELLNRKLINKILNVELHKATISNN